MAHLSGRLVSRDVHCDPININEQLDELARRASPMDGTSNSLGLASFFFS